MTYLEFSPLSLSSAHSLRATHLEGRVEGPWTQQSFTSKESFSHLQSGHHIFLTLVFPQPMSGDLLKKYICSRSSCPCHPKIVALAPCSFLVFPNSCPLFSLSATPFPAPDLNRGHSLSVGVRGLARPRHTDVTNNTSQRWPG